MNLEPTVQRRLTGRVRGPGQYLVITHNADLVPFDDLIDLERIVRVAPGTSGSEIRQPDYSDMRLRDQFRQLQLLEPAEVRSLLFARAVILCEGQTEIGALPRWWTRARAAGLPDLGAANVSFISVSGHSGYGRYIRFLDAFAIPWAVVADGPALRKGQKLPSDLRELGHWPELPLSPPTLRTSPSGAASGSTPASSHSLTSSVTMAASAANSKRSWNRSTLSYWPAPPGKAAEASPEPEHTSLPVIPCRPSAVLGLYEKITDHLKLR